MGTKPKRLDLEAHFYNRAYSDYLRSRPRAPRDEVVGEARRAGQEPTAPDVWQRRGRCVEEALLEHGERRLAAMDAAGVDVQAMERLRIPEADREKIYGGNAARLPGL